MIAFRQVDARYPFLWEDSSQPAIPTVCDARDLLDGDRRGVRGDAADGHRDRHGVGGRDALGDLDVDLVETGEAGQTGK